MKKLKDFATSVVDAVIPPSLETLTERLRAARAELAEARKLAPHEPSGLNGLPDTHLVDASIACCQAAMKVRDAELAFKQGDSESDEIFSALANTLSAKAHEAHKLQSAVQAAKEALRAFLDGIEADVEQAEAARRALTTRRVAENLPGARSLPHDSLRSNLDLRSLLGDLDLAKAGELLRRPAPGRDPSQFDDLQARINEIKKLDTERETRRALAAMPYWEDRDDWVAKFLAKDRAGRNEMEERGHEMRAKASGYR